MIFGSSPLSCVVMPASPSLCKNMYFIKPDAVKIKDVKYLCFVVERPRATATLDSTTETGVGVGWGDNEVKFVEHI